MLLATLGMAPVLMFKPKAKLEGLPIGLEDFVTAFGEILPVTYNAIAAEICKLPQWST